MYKIKGIKFLCTYPQLKKYRTFPITFIPPSYVLETIMSVLKSSIFLFCLFCTSWNRGAQLAIFLL
jgi:hypothetical protein